MKKRWLYLIPILILTFLIAVPVSAAVFPQPVTIQSDLPASVNLWETYGINTQPAKSTFYAEGRQWVFYSYSDGVDYPLVYKSAVPGGTWSNQVVFIEDAYCMGNQFAVWYDKPPSNTVHYARFQYEGEGVEYSIRYGMGTPNANGTITWVGPEEEVAVPLVSMVDTHVVVTIAVDKDGYPWVAWVDGDELGTNMQVSVEASTTKDGTWTQDVAVSEVFAVVDTPAQFISLTPIGTVGPVMELGFTVEDIGGDVALIIATYDSVTNWDAGLIVVGYGWFHPNRPDAFSFYCDYNLTSHLVYTDETGAVGYKARAFDKDWETYLVDVEIKPAAGGAWIPTISGYYHVAGVGDDLICIVHNDEVLYYAIHRYLHDPDDWEIWRLIWQTTGSDMILRHVADYQYGSPVGFAWQYSSEGEPGTNTIKYWWIENTEDQLGYYPSYTLDWGGWSLVQVLPYVFIAIMLVASAAMLATGATIAGIIMLVVSFIIGIVGVGIIQGMIP